MSDAVTIIGELEDLTHRLDKASKEIYKLQVELDPLDEYIDDALNDLLTALIDDYEESDKRLPGEDVRNAIIRKRLREQEPLKFGEHRRKTKELDRLERRAKRIERQISSKQSSLSYLKTEAQAVG